LEEHDDTITEGMVKCFGVATLLPISEFQSVWLYANCQTAYSPANTAAIVAEIATMLSKVKCGEVVGDSPYDHLLTLRIEVHRVKREAERRGGQANGTSGAGVENPRRGQP
jgi:uncharacterized protein (DUF362 family)